MVQRLTVLNTWLACALLPVLALLSTGQAASREADRPSARLTVAYRFEAVLGRKGNGEGEFLGPEGIAVDPVGNLYVADTGNDRVQKLNPDGAYVEEVGTFGWDEGQFNRPVDVATNRGGLEIYVADSRNNRIQVFSPHFRVLGQLGGRNVEGPLRLGTLGGISVSDIGEIVVTDTDVDQVFQIDTYSLTDRSYGGQGYGAGRVRLPAGVAAGERVYVCDTKNDRIAVFDRFGGFKQSLGEGSLSEPAGVCLGPSRSLFVADTGHHRVLVFDLDSGEVVQGIGGPDPGADAGSFREPRDVAVRKDVLYVADTGNHRIQRLRMLVLRK
jgi:DNA-binding beta-propeller fold protein YncE